MPTAPAAEPATPASSPATGSREPTRPPSTSTDAVGTQAADPPTLAILTHYGAIGEALAAIAADQRAGRLAGLLCPHPEGVALAFPDLIRRYVPSPAEFLRACQAQGLIVPQADDPARVVRRRGPDDEALPEQFVVLKPRLARVLLPCREPRHG